MKKIADEYLTDPSEAEHAIEACRDMIDRPDSLRETLQCLVLEPLTSYLEGVTDDHEEVRAASTFMVATMEMIDAPSESNLARLAEAWKEWLNWYGYKCKLKAEKTHRGLVSGGKNSHGMDEHKRAQRDKLIQETINDLCRRHSYSRACTLAASTFELSADRIKKITNNPIPKK